jgi:hypothetical protein
LLEERRLLLRAGTIIDATIIAAPPSSTKNATATHDPEMKQTRKIAVRFPGNPVSWGRGGCPQVDNERPSTLVGGLLEVALSV